MSEDIEILKDAAKYIRDNIELIKKKDFTSLYDNCKNPYFLSPRITKILLDCGVNPLLYMKAIPNSYMRASDIKEIVIPDNILRIDRNAFEECEELQHISIPKSVERVDICAFNYCPSLETITINNPKTYFNNDSIDTYSLPEINYNGTKYEFSQYFNMGAFMGNRDPVTVNCTDGLIELEYSHFAAAYSIV